MSKTNTDADSPAVYWTLDPANSDDYDESDRHDDDQDDDSDDQE